jgi:hypothetical protein
LRASVLRILYFFSLHYSCAQPFIDGFALRSKTPELVRQEFYAFLLVYFSVRGVMHEAALDADEDPDRLSFLHSVKVIRRKIPAFGIFPPKAQA